MKKKPDAIEIQNIRIPNKPNTLTIKINKYFRNTFSILPRHLLAILL
jgi:hypothetical protein